jgi:glycerophosphoryl diester phosphodiesterase
MYAHRGLHSRIAEENTVGAFRRALRTGLDGFECDVRLSQDGIPVIVHDATLERTHRTRARVDALSATELGRRGVATLSQIFDLVREANGRIILDLKVRERSLFEMAERLRTRAGVDARRVTYLLWSAWQARPSTSATVLRAVGTTFRAAHPHVDGVACKYDGTAANRRCIESALRAGLVVNVWCPVVRLTTEMVERFGGRCQLTVGP